MQLEDYFDFQRPDDIRLKGARLGIETIMYEYIYLCSYPRGNCPNLYITHLRAGVRHKFVLPAK